MNTVIHHSADYDGIFCREIARKFLPLGTEFIGWDFGNPQIPFPTHGGDVYVLDLPVEREIFSTPIDPRRLIWIDHHKSSIEQVQAKYGRIPYKGYRIDGVAACRLTWQWFTAASLLSAIKDPIARNLVAEAKGACQLLPNKDSYLDRYVTEPLAVRLAGEYDVWDHREEQQDITFQYGLDAQKEIPWDRLLSNFGTTLVDKYLRDGEAAQNCLTKRNAEVAKAKCFDLDFEGFKFCALNTPQKGSLQFAAAIKPHHDASLAFSWTGKAWVVSMYSDRKEEIDLSVVAVKYGGGGHKRACGFQSDRLPWIP